MLSQSCVCIKSSNEVGFLRSSIYCNVQKSRISKNKQKGIHENIKKNKKMIQVKSASNEADTLFLWKKLSTWSGPPQGDAQTKVTSTGVKNCSLCSPMQSLRQLRPFQSGYSQRVESQ
jgi:hypothetical protein